MIRYTVFCNYLIGETKGANSLQEFIEKKMTKRQKLYWSHIQYKDEYGRTIQITREFLEDQGMMLDEVVLDWIEHNEDLFDMDILSLNKI